MPERISNLIDPGLREKLRRLGEKGDLWKEILATAGGDVDIAELLVDIRGIKDLGGLLPEEKPLLKGSSSRVAAQKHSCLKQS